MLQGHTWRSSGNHSQYQDLNKLQAQASFTTLVISFQLSREEESRGSTQLKTNLLAVFKNLSNLPLFLFSFSLFFWKRERSSGHSWYYFSFIQKVMETPVCKRSSVFPKMNSNAFWKLRHWKYIKWNGSTHWYSCVYPLIYFFWKGNERPSTLRNLTSTTFQTSALCPNPFPVPITWLHHSSLYQILFLWYLN